MIGGFAGRCLKRASRLSSVYPCSCSQDAKARNARTNPSTCVWRGPASRRRESTIPEATRLRICAVMSGLLASFRTERRCGHFVGWRQRERIHRESVRHTWCDHEGQLVPSVDACVMRVAEPQRVGSPLNKCSGVRSKMSWFIREHSGFLCSD